MKSVKYLQCFMVSANCHMTRAVYFFFCRWHANLFACEKKYWHNTGVCLQEVQAWLSNNFLNVNESKTELVWFGGPAMSDLSNLGELSPYCTPVVRDLWVMLDSSLKFKKQINSVVKSEFFHLRLLAKVKPFLSGKDLEMLIHDFVFSRLDYCNSLSIGVSKHL